MTSVTVAPAANKGGYVGTRQSLATRESQRVLSRAAELFVGDGQPPVTGVRPAVRKVRPAGGGAPTRVGSSRRQSMPGWPRPLPCDRSYEPDLHGSRLTRRGKVVVGAIWLVFAMAIVFMVSRPAEVPMPAETATVTVTSGDTLWELAGDVAPDVDPRVTVEQIIELNGLRSAGDIHPGDLLLVPMTTD